MRSPLKPVLESLPALRAGELDAAGWLAPGSKNDYVSAGLVAQITAARGALVITALTSAGGTTTVRLVLHQLPMPSGGTRPMLVCPGCDEGRITLYWCVDRFRCGHCLGLRHSSQRQSGLTRRRKRVEALLERSTIENTPALYARPPHAHAPAWRRVLQDFADVRATEATRARA
jgi:hypothetical protein